MAEHPNVARIRRGYDIRGGSTEFSEGDRAEIEDLFADDLVYHGHGTSEFANDFHGRDQFFAVERQFGRTVNMHQDISAIYADDFHAIAYSSVRAECDGQPATWTESQVFHFGPDGRVTDTWGIPNDQDLVDDFWRLVAASQARASTS